MKLKWLCLYYFFIVAVEEWGGHPTWSEKVKGGHISVKVLSKESK